MVFPQGMRILHACLRTYAELLGDFTLKAPQKVRRARENRRQSLTG
jgi:hypothetical protein